MTEAVWESDPEDDGTDPTPAPAPAAAPASAASPAPATASEPATTDKDSAKKTAKAAAKPKPKPKPKGKGKGNSGGYVRRFVCAFLPQSSALTHPTHCACVRVRVCLQKTTATHVFLWW